ncbi:XRE family transcriptional regulator [Mesorhizobium sp.]|uniref:XRE family transcriptional regulator n=1 Tax=Mesorhizobium sp. TaxID=1871066 RepID=UPI0025ED5B02|nr:XRE family transcriptional regulator [Mesorhizobium sp.]
MSKIVPLPGVQPALLKWARESAHLSLEEVAGRLKKAVEEIDAWESGANAPSYAQLEKLAYELYKRPLAIFFLPSPPAEPRPEAEFRALPDTDLRRLSRETVFLIRRARAYQASLVELFDGRSPIAEPLWKRVDLDVSKPIAPQAAVVRASLGVPAPGANEWGGADGDEALKLWRKAIEAGGVFVFKDTFKQREISGFCLEHPELPVVMINNSATKTRQIFSLLHEVAHVLIGWRAISTFDDAPLKRLPPAEQRIERFCNQIAAEILVPAQDFASQVAGLPQNVEALSSDRFAALAARYRVSREVILRRFRDADRVSQDFYERRKLEWDGQRVGKESSGGSFYLTKGAYLSERLMSEVFARYGRRQISVDEAADFIGVKPKQVDELESRFLRGLAA